MASRRIKAMFLATAGVLGASTWFIYSIMAAQGQGALAQAPLNNQVQVPPAFIMAVDDSGSMTFQHQFPGDDGYACWSRSNDSFFTDSGALRTSGDTCRYAYSYTGPRIGTGYLGIPPVDNYGFSRSSDFNPSYFDPTIRYEPWVESDGTPYPQASTAATRLDPRNSSPTLNLASWYSDANDRSRFRAYEDMWLPKGTEYRLTGNNCGGLSGGGSWRTITGNNGHTMTDTCDMYVKYWPATFFLKYSSDSDPYPQLEGTSGAYDSVARERVRNACGTGCDLWRYRIASSNSVALKNFANWFSFYGNRNRAMIAGMTRSMATVNNMRVGYFKINSHASYDSPRTNANERVTMRDMAVPADRVSLYDSMIALTANGGTPNRQAVRAAGEQFTRTDAGAPVALACQRNAAMLFTDGFSNTGGPNVGNVDSGMGAPFADGHSNTMADIATRYYLNDANGNSPLRTDLPAGQVPVPDVCPSDDPSVDCQANLHVNFYGITLGGRGDLYDPNNEVNPFTNAGIYNNWPARQDDDRSTVDDIWHAATNTRGEFISARTPADITDAMRRILSAVSSGASPSGTLALTGSRINTRSLAVQPSYEIRNEGTDWFSKLAAFKLEINPLTRVVSETQIWEASDKLASQSHESRKSHTWYGTGTGAAQISGVTLAMLCNNPRPGMSRCTAGDITTRLGITAGDAVNYLLGDTSKEVRNPGGKLRSRTTVLGDIVNSTPVVSAPTDDYGYRSLGTVGGVNYGQAYNQYMEDKKSRNAMVYVGANDGMLHAFHGGINADGDVDSGSGGKELFAYVPRAVLGHMGNLLFPYVAADQNDQRFVHRYFVDGPVAVSDAYYGGGWKTVLVGTAGAGGRSVFALNVSNPGSFNASSRLWEIDDQNANSTIAANIGHVLGKPVIVPVREGSGVAWKAIFGNGYNSSGGKAVLFVVDIATGAVRMIEAIEAAAPAGSNGLGNIAVVDRWAPPLGDPTGGLTRSARDGFGDTVYAADQKGAIWRFDLRDSATQITTPLFTTQSHTEDGGQYRQPITGGLSVTAGRGGGVMLLFGTGSFSFVSDSNDDSVQTIYGVLDSGFSGTRTRADLAGRSSTTSADGETRVVTGGGDSSAGWYLDLPTGERAVGYPRVASGVLFIPTYAPAIVDGCSTSGLNWLYGLNTRTGAAELSSVRFGSTSGDTQGEGVGAVSLETLGTAPVKDVGITVLSRAAPPNPGEAPPPDDGCWMRITVPGMEEEMFVPYPCGRQSWRQLQ